ncbi:hypothetical protein BC940DRAFT_310164 [Gongronella butleri]|nr:hypothetical protein BC940DRAFT_310164 [Gongronella butleri]
MYRQSEEEASWRDQSILNDANARPRTSRGVNNQSRQAPGTTTTPESTAVPWSTWGEQPALAGTTTSTRQQARPTLDESPERQPDDYWVMPPTSAWTDVLGPSQIYLDDIRSKTGAFLALNVRKHQVDLWGDVEAIRLAKHSLEHLGTLSSARKEVVRRTKKWGKPERELTESEKRREEKKQRRLQEDKSYQGFPSQPQPYHAIFHVPDQSMPLEKFEGDKTAYLNAIRADCKSWITRDEQNNEYVVTGPIEANVFQAAARLRNWYLKQSRVPLKIDPLHLLWPPSNPVLLRYSPLPERFIPADLYVDDEDVRKYRQLEPIFHGNVQNSVKYLMNPSRAPAAAGANDGDANSHAAMANNNLIDLEALSLDAPQHTPIQQGTMDGLIERNARKLEEVLYGALESVRLTDWELTMEVIFGRYYLLNYPRHEDSWTLQDIADRLLPHPRLLAKVAPCVGTTYEHVQGLLEYMDNHGEAFADSPRTSYTITALQEPKLRPRATSIYSTRETQMAANAALAAPLDPLQTTLTVQNFTFDGHVSLWNCVTSERTLVSAATASPDGAYSWETRLKYARRLPSELNTPHGEFVAGLRRSPGKSQRLILMRVPDYQANIVCQNTKWVYAWKDYIIEIQKQEYWDIEEVEPPRPKQRVGSTSSLPIDLSLIPPHRTHFAVTMHREAWRNRFAQNLNLQIGEAPTWIPHDFTHGQDDETIDLLQQDAKALADIMTTVMPFYCEVQPVL